VRVGRHRIDEREIVPAEKPRISLEIRRLRIDEVDVRVGGFGIDGGGAGVGRRLGIDGAARDEARRRGGDHEPEREREEATVHGVLLLPGFLLFFPLLSGVGAAGSVLTRCLITDARDAFAPGARALSRSTSPSTRASSSWFMRTWTVVGADSDGCIAT
jgi:hypothetical protein